ncbi:MAG: right-handed parallel beta-helix repeat-containing protein [Candidatus Lokiarchaeota archaeon]|nr:right-handed parallel beta-helix repeat-containing protein [Candidatus Lokiarchaeota archaeon]
MKTKTKQLGVLLLMLFIFPLILTYEINSNHEHKTNIINPKTSGTYVGIWIDDTLTTNGTSWGNWTWARSQPWCTDGDGTKENPYIIKDSTFIPAGPSDCLSIYHSRKYFIVSNCTSKDIPVGTFSGIKLNNVTNANIIDNHAYNNSYGIYLDDCYYNNISGNSVNNNSLGIYLYFCDNNTVSGNTANYNVDGLYLEESNDNTVTGNTANGNSQNGIYSYFCDYNNITGNAINNNGDSGLDIEDNCDNNIISGNTVNNNTYNGIYIYDDCNYNTISNNIINGMGTQDFGISLHWYSLNNTIINNIANYNEEIGIEIYDYCENTTVSNNIVSYNGINGIGIYDFSDNNILTKNVLYNNTIGVYIDNGDNNTFYKNAFGKNGLHALDGGIDNKWNTSIIGNYWDNHTGPDLSPQDGIVDNPYMFIDGPAGSIDFLPIAEDDAPRITINSPLTGRRFSTAPSFNVEIIDVALYEMWYTLDGGLNNYTFRINGTINQAAWDALSNGSVTIRFYARDVLGNVAFEEVTIIKGVSADKLDPGIVAAIIVSVIGGIILAALVILVKKGKISLEKIKEFSFKRK